MKKRRLNIEKIARKGYISGQVLEAQSAHEAKPRNDGADFVGAFSLYPLECQAPHPAAKRKPWYRNRNHGATLAKRPWHTIPTGRVLDTWEDVEWEKGYVAFQCPSRDCRKISEFRVISTGENRKRKEAA